MRAATVRKLPIIPTIMIRMVIVAAIISMAADEDSIKLLQNEQE